MERSGLTAGLLAASVLLLAGRAHAGVLVFGARSAQLAGWHGAELLQQAAPQQTAPKSSSGQTQSPAPAQSAAPASTAAGSATHSITLTFDYDFTKTPACSDTVKPQCVAKFGVYDISGSKPYLLFYAPVPKGAHGVMKGITATSPPLLFAVGKHRIAVSAREPNGVESPPHDCKVIVEIKAADATPTVTSGAH
ncbi:MAG: hypothetical protein WA211_21200 [Candidatus Acidiferrales bacterium]